MTMPPTPMEGTTSQDIEHDGSVIPGGEQKGQIKNPNVENHDSSNRQRQFDWAGYYRKKIENRFIHDTETKNPYEQYPVYHWWRLLENVPWLNTLRNYIPEGGTVCEVGAGVGTAAIALTEELRAQGVSVTATDVSSQIVDDCAKYAASVGVDTQRVTAETHLPHPGVLELATGDMFKLNPSEKYDVVYNQGTLEHYNHEQRIEAIKALLRAGKVVAISVPLISQWKSSYRELMGLTVNKSGPDQEADKGNIGDEEFLRWQEFELELREAGAEVMQRGGYWVVPQESYQLDPATDLHTKKVLVPPKLRDGVKIYDKLLNPDGTINPELVFSFTMWHPHPGDDSVTEAQCYESALYSGGAMMGFWVVKPKEQK